MPILGYQIRLQFPILQKKLDGHPLVYLDNAATTQKPQVVLDAMRKFYEKDNANVKRGMHVLAERATELYEAARKRVQKFLNARKAHEIIFTKSTTESINLVARAWGEANLKRGDVVLLSLLEHHSNIVPWLQLRDRLQQTDSSAHQYTGILVSPEPRQQKEGEKRETLEIAWLGIERDGTLKLDEAEQILRTGRVKLVALTCVSNVLGVVTPFKELTQLAHAHGALVLLDAAQLAAHHPIDVQDFDCDFLAFSGHKVYGPTGIGILFGKEEHLKAMPPFLGGGTMIQEVFTTHFTPASLPEKFEAGTPPIAEAVGLHAALDWLAELGWGNVQAHEQELFTYALKKLSELPFVEVLGPKDSKRIMGCISFVVRCKRSSASSASSPSSSSSTIHPHDLTEYIGRPSTSFRRGSASPRRTGQAPAVCLRAGHHCAQPLHDFLGYPATTRLSIGIYNTKEDIDRMCEVLEEAFAFFMGK